MIETPTIVDLPAQAYAALAIFVARDQIKTVMGPGIQELMATLKVQGLTPTGSWFTHHVRRPTDTFDFEIGIPVAAPVTASGRVRPRTSPSMRIARTIYIGPYEGLAGAWGEFTDWIVANGFVRSPDLWEYYLTGPESSSDSDRASA